MKANNPSSIDGADTNAPALLTQQIASRKGFLLRIGRHSGSECVTLDDLRRIYIRQHKKFSDAPYTRWLAATHRNDDKTFRPFGWIFVQPSFH